MAWVPVPLQMLFAAFGAVLMRVNLPIAVAMVWVTNPITMPPLFWFAYELGLWLLRRPGLHLDTTPTLGWFAEAFGQIWQPFLLGCLVLGVTSAATGYAVSRLLWRLHVVRSWDARSKRRESDPAPLAAPEVPPRAAAQTPDAAD
ncbi:MAG: DUF2062 domain-containing protein [Gammaproteobacteria bacterium]|nr:DUF2062 domain-containing protein [Gammaproteobacteria bacterium]